MTSHLANAGRVCCRAAVWGLAMLVLSVTSQDLSASYCLLSIAENEIDSVSKIVVTSTRVLIATQTQLWQLIEGSVKRIPGDFRQVNVIRETRDGVLIGTDNGLWRLTDSGAERVAPDFGRVLAIGETPDGVLIGTVTGLWPLLGERPKPLRYMRVSQIQAIPAGALIWTNQGLWRLMANRLEPLHDMRGPYKLHETRDGVLMGTDNGVWRLTNSGIEHIASNLGEVLSIGETRDGVLIGTAVGLWRLIDGGVERIPSDFGRVLAIGETADRVLIGTDEGLWRLAGHRPEPVDRNIRPVPSKRGSWDDYYHIHHTPAGVLIATAGKLWRLAGDQVKELVPSSGRVYSIHQTSQGVLIRTQEGLFRLAGNPLSTAKITIVDQPSSDLKLGEQSFVRWRLDDYPCLDLDKSLLDGILTQHLVIKHNGHELKEERRSPIILNRPRAVDGADFHYLLERYKRIGKYELQIIATDPSGEDQPLESDWITFSVGKTSLDVILDWATVILDWATFRLAPAIGVAYVVGFIVLVSGARWSPRCFELLTDPALHKFGIYFDLALRYLHPIQLWVFERYFQAAKRHLSWEHTYIPVPITCHNGVVISSTDLLGEVHEGARIWVHGESGTGKTAMVQALMQEYFTLPSLRNAWHTYGFIPVFVTVRAYPGGAGDGAMWVPDVTRAALSGVGVSFRNAEFFQRLLENGTFAVVLDGLNEVSHDDDVRRYANITPSVRLLVTSQTAPADSTFVEYRLPRATPEFTAQLLTAFLGKDPGEAIFESLSDNLLSEIRSGYDVQLLADVAAQGVPFPRDRIGLYQAILDAAVRSAPEHYPEHVICRVAWELWLESKRQFHKDDRLTEDLLLPLEKAKIVIARGKAFEFRHDLMRGYLAARWAVHHATSIQDTSKRLNTEEIWRLSLAEQDLVFPLLVAMVQRAGDLQSIAQFAAEDPGQRVRLQAAVQETARRKGWLLQVVVGHNAQT